MSEDTTEQMPLLRALADPVRLDLLRLLHDRGETCVCELLELLGTTQSNVSTHLRVLRDVGLVRSEKLGKWVFYSLRGDTVAELLEWLGTALAPGTVALDRPTGALYQACCANATPCSRSEAEALLAGVAPATKGSCRDGC